MSGDHACYAFQVAEYAKHFTCFSLDLRGTGETDKPEGVYSTEVLADDVAAFMQAVGIQRAHVSGLSLGAAIGMWLAAKHPDKVQSLSLHSGWPKTDPFIKTVVEGWQVMARALGSVPEMVILRHLPLVPHARAVRGQAGLHPVAGRLCSQPAGTVSRGFHPAVECRDCPRRRGAARPDHGADPDHIRTHRHVTSTRFADRMNGAYSRFRAADLRRMRTRGALREGRGVQSEDLAVPAAPLAIRHRVARRTQWLAP